MDTVAPPVAKYTNYGQLRPVLVRHFLARVHVGAARECWEWRGQVDRKGYGTAMVHERGKAIIVGAHRVAYLLDRYTIDPALHIDHLCRNRRCCNPSHLEAVTPRENVARGLLVALRTECKRGHPWVDENIIIVKNRDRVVRNCRTCYQAAQARSRARRSAARAARRQSGFAPATA